YELARSHAGADLAVVNTCGFLNSAQTESLAAIGKALNENGKVIVTGCMGAEPEKITARYPQVLAVTGPQQYESVVEAVPRGLPPRHDPFVDLLPPEGIKLTPRHYAYLKISEGCNNRCSFCIIPKLRGKLRSRPAADVLREAERLVAAGVKELLVISQDTSAYGSDLRYAASAWKGHEVRAKFLDLARALGELGAWVRLLYLYPPRHVEEVILLTGEGRVLPFLVLLFQPAAPAVLRRMKRPAAQEKTLRRIARWREVCPEVTIRSSFIVGFPGESEEDFELLLDWLEEAQLDRVGCFRYEPVAGAQANGPATAGPDDVKEERWHRLMRHQQAISARCLKRKVGTRQPVIIDEVRAGSRSEANGGMMLAKGRTRGDAPEIDGVVHVTSRRPLRLGEIATVRIERADEYDLHGTAVGFLYFFDGACGTLAASLTAFSQHIHDRAGQCRQLLRLDRECRREIDDGAEGADKNPLLHEARAQAFEIVDTLQLHHTDRAFHPHVLDAWERPARRKVAREGGCDIRNLPQPRLPIEQVEGGVGGGTAERVAHECGHMRQCIARRVRPERVEYFVTRNCGRERQRASGQCFRQSDDVRRDTGCLAGEQAAGAAETGEDFIENQKKLIAVRRFAQALQHRRGVKAHPARALRQRLDDDACELVGMTFETARKARGAFLALRQFNDTMLGQYPVEPRMHARLRVRNCHRTGGVAVIAAL